MAGADHDMQIEILKRCTVVRIFGYDRAGRRTSATYSGVTTSYAYDYESRITSITRTGVTTNSFAYNGLDTRVRKTDSAGTTSYERAGAYVTDSLLKSTVSSTTTDYTPGVSSRVGSDSTFLHSGIKNADTQTDDGGDVSAMRQYDAFGNPVAAWGGWQGPFGYGGPYGYQTDPDHGLMLLGHRYYEADTGRFLTRDPIKDGRNWYGYCGGNPLCLHDRDGLQRTRLSLTQVIQLIRAINDQAWDMFFMLVEQITGVEVPDEVKEVFEAIHFIEAEPGAKSVNHWKGEIREFMQRLYKVQKF
jgi:RHS repeat-associated protein